MSGLGLKVGRPLWAKVVQRSTWEATGLTRSLLPEPTDLWGGQVSSGMNQPQLGRGHTRTCPPVCRALHISHSYYLKG